MFVSFSHRFLPFASNAGIFEGLSLPSLRRRCVAQFANPPWRKSRQFLLSERCASMANCPRKTPAEI
jgi:hypothetical protein